MLAMTRKANIIVGAANRTKIVTLNPSFAQGVAMIMDMNVIWMSVLLMSLCIAAVSLIAYVIAQ